MTCEKCRMIFECVYDKLENWVSCFVNDCNHDSKVYKSLIIRKKIIKKCCCHIYTLFYSLWKTLSSLSNDISWKFLSFITWWRQRLLFHRKSTTHLCTVIQLILLSTVHWQIWTSLDMKIFNYFVWFTLDCTPMKIVYRVHWSSSTIYEKNNWKCFLRSIWIYNNEDQSLLRIV